MAGVTQSQIKGEAGTGYESPEGLGAFACANCEYFDAKSSSCGQKTMMSQSVRPRLRNGRVKVSPKGCCEYVDRLGVVTLTLNRKDDDELDLAGTLGDL